MYENDYFNSTKKNRFKNDDDDSKSQAKHRQSNSINYQNLNINKSEVSSDYKTNVVNSEMKRKIMKDKNNFLNL